jgi:hypothetical protein
MFLNAINHFKQEEEKEEERHKEIKMNKIGVE